jgi:hypothetical protein
MRLEKHSRRQQFSPEGAWGARTLFSKAGLSSTPSGQLAIGRLPAARRRAPPGPALLSPRLATRRLCPP